MASNDERLGEPFDGVYSRVFFQSSFALRMYLFSLTVTLNMIDSLRQTWADHASSTRPSDQRKRSCGASSEETGVTEKDVFASSTRFEVKPRYCEAADSDLVSGSGYARRTRSQVLC
jgi:hypothetical protein